MKIYHNPNDPQPEQVERYAIYDVRGIEPPKKENQYHIFLLRSQLISDFEYALNIIIRARRNEKNNQDNALEDTDKLHPILNRWIDKYVSKAKARFGKGIIEPIQSSDTAVAKTNDEIDISFKMGEWWNNNTLPLLTDAVHDYVSCGLLYEYLLTYLTENDKVTLSKKEQLELAYEEIKRLVTAYVPGRIKKSYHPFP